MLTLNKFSGTLVGALVGDCFGANFEYAWHNLKITAVQSWLCEVRAHQRTGIGMKLQPYTDDTAMCRGIAQSLIECKEFNAKHMAERFSENFFEEPWRGYGGSVGQVFKRLRKSKYIDPYKPAAEQFDGNGSYGNGGAMRVAPVPLHCYKAGVEAVQEQACQATRLTHSHPQAVQGAVLLATAIWIALNNEHCDVLDPLAFLTQLRQLFDEKKFDISPTTSSDDHTDSETQGFHTYDEKLHYIEQIFTTGEEPSRQTIVDKLGTDIAAFDSVPAAIYSFLRSNSPVADLESSNNFERTVLYAIALGGDTDTVASMAGAVAGAYWGVQPKGDESGNGIPWSWSTLCEGVEDATDFATKLLQLNDTQS